MADNDHIFKAFSNFDTDDMPARAEVSRRMLARLKDIDDPATTGPTTHAAKAALASSVVAHAVIELEMQLIALKEQLANHG
jgi:hypothetical protein